MLYTYDLILYYKDGSKEVIFTSTNLKEVDNQTIQFETIKEICDHYKCDNIKLCYKGGRYGGNLPIKLKGDCFKKESLISKYKLYLAGNPTKRRDFLKKISRSVGSGIPPRSKLDERCLAVYNHFDSNHNLYLPSLHEILITYFGREKTEYFKCRAAYFELKQQGIKVDCYEKLDQGKPKSVSQPLGYYTMDEEVAQWLKDYKGPLDFKEILMYIQSKNCTPTQFASIRPHMPNGEYPQNSKLYLKVKKSDTNAQE